jgi:predicted TIM-barrel fold metal-dependent hydrolase
VNVQIVDAHTHYWQPATPDRPWDPAGMNRWDPISVEDLLRDASEAGVAQVIQVTPSIMGEDNRYALEGAERYPERVLAVFGRINPDGPNVERRLRDLAAHPKFAGVRFTMFGAREQGWLGDGSLDRFLKLAASLDLLVAMFFPSAAAEMRALAIKHPECTFLADHCALDQRLAQQDPPADPFATFADVLALAATPNVYMKVSSFPEFSHTGFPFSDVAPRLHAVYETAGADRLIWGSNYPPSKDHATYRECVRFLTEAPIFTADDKAKIMGGNMRALISRAK